MYLTAAFAAKRPSVNDPDEYLLQKIFE